MLHDREIALDLPLLHVLKDAGLAAPSSKCHSAASSMTTDHELDVMSTVSRSNDTAIIRGTFKPPSRGEFTFIASGNLLIGTIQMGDRLIRLSTSPTVGCDCSKSIPKNCHRIDLHSSQPVAIPRSLCHTVPCLARMIHEHFCCNRGFAAATPSAGRLAPHSLDILFKYASEARGSACPSRYATARFRDELS